MEQLLTQQRITIAGNGDDRSTGFAHLFIESDSAKIHILIHSRNRGPDCDTFVVTDQGMKDLFFVEERSGKALAYPSIYTKFHIKEGVEFVLTEGQKLPVINWTKVRVIRPKARSGNQPWYHMIFSAGEQNDMIMDLSY